MLYKKTLLITFFLSLFILQQTQVSAKFLSNSEEAPQVELIQASNLPTQLHLTVAHLDDQNKPIYQNGKIVKCYTGDRAYGCGEGGSGYPYAQNPVWIEVESNYLLNVVPREMNVVENDPTVEALKAQAIAARSYAAYRIPTDNSVNFQIYIPNSYELYDPSSSDLIYDAVRSTQGQYLSQGGSVIDAQFASDSVLRTATCINADGTQCNSYLIKVEDPISAQGLSNPACNAKNNGNSSTPGDDFGKVWGMSQKSATRWSLGNQCTTIDGNEVWPVKWNDYRQILAHYYTGIDIVNASGAKVAPNDRWNLLNHNIPSQMNAGQTYNVSMMIQNTSTSNWGDNDVVILGYQWTLGDQPINSQNWRELGSVPSAISGESKEFIVPNIVAPSTGGEYTLHLDLRRQNGTWFSEADWPDAEIPVQVIAPTPTPTQTPTITPTPVVTCPARFWWSGFNTNYCQGTWPGPCQSTGTVSQSDGLLTVNENINFDIGGYPRGGQGGFDGRINIPPGTTMYVSYNVSVISDCAEAGVYVNNALVTSSPASFTNPGPFSFFYVRAMCKVQWDTQNVANITVNLYSEPSCLAGPTPVPTFLPTPTPAPDPCPFSQLWNMFFGKGNTNSPLSAQGAPNALNSLPSLQQVVFDINLFYAVRDKILSQTTEGQRYIDLHNANGPEISKLLLDNRDLADEALATIQMWQPNLRAWVNGQGSSVTITPEQVQAVQDFLDHLSAEGSLGLQQTIANERARRPLEQAVGMSMDQAWAYFNGYTLTWLPPISNANPYRAEAGRTIPVEFAIQDFQGNFVIDETTTLKIRDANGNIVAGPVGINDNPTQGISIQGKKYHYNFQATGLADGLYMIQISYNSAGPDQPTIYTVQLSKGKNK